MPNQRLMNCDFFLKGAFDGVSSNEAKLLYFYFFINADDYGFVGNASKIIKTLNEESAETNGLVPYTFENAADELVDKGFLFRFTDRHQNQILLIRHFFIHNKYNPKYITTNYFSLRAKVELIDGCWELKREPLKENKENNVNNVNNVNEKEEKVVDDEEDDDNEWGDVLKELENLKSSKGDTDNA